VFGCQTIFHSVNDLRKKKKKEKEKNNNKRGHKRN
jgi:hypothetical protein